MDGVIKNFRRGRHTVNERQLVIEIEGVDSRKKAYSMVGSKVQWKTPSGKVFTGKVASAHGNGGAVRALFKKGLPGQCIGSKVAIAPREKQKPKPEKAKAESQQEGKEPKPKPEKEKQKSRLKKKKSKGK